jgi:hypothetical protein
MNDTSTPVGTIKVMDAVPIAMQSAINARPECKAQIEAEVEKAYPNHKNDNRLMNGTGGPPDDKTKAHLPNSDAAG